MNRNIGVSPELSIAQGESILELGSQTQGGPFDPQAIQVMSELFVLGMIEVSNEDRCVSLTKGGWLAHAYLTSGGMTRVDSNLATND